MYLWRKLASAKFADAWVERLRCVGPERLAIVQPAHSRCLRLEVYCTAASEAEGLLRNFGGQVREVADESWQPLPVTAPGKPISIAGKLLITGRAGELETLRAANPRRRVLCIPAAMAFGTGEHATTAMCLRFLAETSKGLPAASWKLLDLGMGSGVLALAGCALGAAETLGLDNDRHAVRTAKGNAKLNGISAARFARADLLKWTPEGQWPVVTANLFSELLITLLPMIVRTLAPGGRLIASGVLASQAPEVEAAFRAAHLKLMAQRKRRRWVAFLCSR